MRFFPLKINKSDLCKALSEGNIKKAEDIISKWPSIDVKNDKGLTALHQAVKGGEVNVVQFLVDKGADLDVQGNSPKHKGWTPLHYAANLGYLAIIEILLSNGARADIEVSILSNPGSKIYYQYTAQDLAKNNSKRVFEERGYLNQKSELEITININ